MLSELRVENLGVIDHISLELGEGMTAVTGETGAGKTLVVGAIELLVGGRADSGVVRAGAEAALVDGRFELGDSELVLSRVVPSAGRSKAHRDRRPITAADLTDLGAELVELHGQHSQQSLLSARSQRHALDVFAKTDLAPLRAARERLRALVAEREALGGDERSRAREMDLVRFQLDEIDGAAIEDAAEEERLRREEDLLSDAQAHREAAAGAAAAMEDEGGIRDQLAAAIARLEGRSPFEEVSARLAGLLTELEDAAGGLRNSAEQIADDPQRLEELRQRRTVLTELRRKYGTDLAEVLAEAESLRARLTELERHDQRAGELDGEIAEAERVEAEAAAAVAGTRREAAPELARQVQKNLAELAMPDAMVQVTVGNDDPGDEVMFLLAANPGSPPQPLAKVASGGELARAMLALRLVLSGGPPTAVFDEVDAGIGGTAATAVARALAKVSQQRQVLVVTHLPQVAAAADSHFVVEKQTSGGSTATIVRHLSDPAEREAELARMLSGHPDSSAAQRHARELLER